MKNCVNCGRELVIQLTERGPRFPDGICPSCAEWVGAASMFLPDKDLADPKKGDEPAENGIEK